MSDAFVDYLVAPEGVTGTAQDYMGQVSTDQGAYNIGPQQAFTTTPAASAQGFTPTETGYTPTFDFASMFPMTPEYGTPPTGYQAPQVNLYGPQTSQLPIFGTSPSFLTAAKPTLVATTPAFGGTAPRAAGGVSTATGAAPAAPSAAAPGTTDQAAQGGGLSDILKSLGGLKGLTSIAGGLMGYLANQRAQQQAEDVGNQIKAAYQNAAQQTQQLAQPYMTAGGPQLSMALQGSLSPAQQQIFQAQQAQLAQNAVRTGGVGAIQTAAAEQAMYQQALQNQQAMALQLLSPGNQLMTTAIQQQLQGTTQGLTTTLQYQNMANEAAAKLFQQLGSIGASTPQSQSNAGVP